MSQFTKKKNGIIEGTNIFVENYIRPIKVIMVGAVHIAQYLINFAKSLNFEISIIDPRGYFASEQRFPGIKIINKWPKEAFTEIKTDQNTALIALTHDPKIDDPALQHALKKNFFYIGALGSKKTHANRCARLKESGFTNEEINKIFGPIGIKLGGKSAPEIALSIIAQLVSEVYKKIMISAILLAAGQSKRMKGENKLIKEIKNIPLIKHSVKNILGSAIDELIIVLGHEK